MGGGGRGKGGHRGGWWGSGVVERVVGWWRGWWEWWRGSRGMEVVSTLYCTPFYLANSSFCLLYPLPTLYSAHSFLMPIRIDQIFRNRCVTWRVVRMG